VVLAAIPAQAASTFTVNSTTDAPDANPGDGVCDSDSEGAGNQCTLRGAIQEANALSGDDVIEFAPSVNGTITLGGSELTINSNLKIEGPGADVLSVSANRLSRVFKVQSGTVEISGLTITGGSAIDIRSTSCRTSYLGGGIYNNGTLTVSNSTISDNTALELPSIGWQLFVLGSSQGDSTASSSLLDTYATRLLTEPLSYVLSTTPKVTPRKLSYRLASSLR
jgi:CSLREA domain-containing protein